MIISLQLKAQTIFLTDQCDDATPWTFGASAPSGTYGMYTTWKMGYYECALDASSLAITSYNRNGNGIFNCDYTETSTADIIAKRNMDARTFQTLQLQFDWRCQGEVNGSAVDYGQVGYSTDNGVTFTWLATGGYNNSGKYYSTPAVVRNQTIALPTSLNNTQFVIGFRWMNNSSVGNFPGFIIDNIRLAGTALAGGAPESSKTLLLSDECKTDEGWILGKGPSNGTAYTAWKIGNDSLCTIDRSTLAIEAWNKAGSNKWTCDYVDDASADIRACKKIDARNYENIEVKFDWSCNGEYYPYYLYDYGQVGYSVDGGATFVWLSTGGMDAQGRYFAATQIQRNQKLSLPSIVNGKEFLVAFRWINDNSVFSLPGFIVDNIRISGTAKATQLVTVFNDNLDSKVGWQLKKAAADPAGNTLAWTIDDRCSINGNSLSINLYNNSVKDWQCGYATNAAASIIASRTISTGKASNLFLKMDWKCASTSASDYAQIGYSTDGGLTFTWLAYGGVSNTGKYYNQSTVAKATLVKLPATLEGKTFDLGIRWINDAGTNTGQPFTMDNISVVGEPTNATTIVTQQKKVIGITTESIKLAGKKTEADVNALTEDGKIVLKEYFDGSVRKIQDVVWKGSPSKTDIVSPMWYDEDETAGTQFLPYKASTTDGEYHEDMLGEQDIYYKTAKEKFYTTEYAFSRVVTENSPANRLKEKGGVGKEYQPDIPGTTRTMVQKFSSVIDNNPPTVVDAIKSIKLISGPALSVDYYQAPAENLWVTEITDEDKKIRKVYTNNRGMKILERQYATNGTTILTQTYYVYDDFNRLRVVIQPEGLTASKISAIPATLPSTFMDDYCFQYNYDERGRLISKRSPGAGWVEVAYDRWDRPVVTQDANQKAKNPQEFSYVKYDAQNRPVETGTFKAVSRTLTMAIVRTELTNSALGARFETRTLGTLPNRDFTNNLSYPKADATNTLTSLIKNYYDDYKYTDLAGLSFAPGLGYTTASASSTPIGATTGIKLNVLGTSTWTTSANYYDQYNNLIQIQHANINNVLNTVTKDYDFQGRAVNQIEDNKLTAGAGAYVQTTNQYDHLGRLTRILHKINAQAQVILADYKYTDLGSKIAEKNMYSTNLATPAYLQSVDYTYNERGWLTRINNPDLTNDGVFNNDANDIFGMQFNYYKDLEIDNTKACYNGNVAEIFWKSTSSNKKQGYLYTYDDLNRLTSAGYRRYYNTNWTSSSENNNFTVGAVTYDANGNIKTLQQNGVITGNSTYGLIDNISYVYQGNRLSTVEDAVSTLTSYTNDFENGPNAKGSADYVYDPNGNLIVDDNKRISSITYNVLNLPEQITQTNGKKTIFTYDASGNKLRKQEYNGATLTLTNDYLGSTQYLNGTVDAAFTAEGRVYYLSVSGTYRYDYFMKDQVGNIRLTYTSNAGVVQILQRDEYYPFGNTFDSNVGSGGANTYKFNGMDYQENGLNTYDFHARMYDPQLGRTFQPDPMADAFAAVSPFSFLMNNPIRYTDPTGMSSDDDWDLGGGDGNFGTISPGGPGISTVSGSWFLQSGGYTAVSQKWMGLVQANGGTYYRGKLVSSEYAARLQSFGVNPFTPPSPTKKVFEIFKETVDDYIYGNDNIWLYQGTSYKYSIEEVRNDQWGSITIVANTYGEDDSGAGHAWIELAKKDGGTITVSLWGNKGEQELWYNREKGRLKEMSRTRTITNEQYNKLVSFLSSPDNVNWTAWNTCAGFSAAIWNHTTGESLNARENSTFTTPRQLKESLAIWNKIYPIKP
jgi:RHS repeat-associated protein